MKIKWYASLNFFSLFFFSCFRTQKNFKPITGELQQWIECHQHIRYGRAFSVIETHVASVSGMFYLKRAWKIFRCVLQNTSGLLIKATRSFAKFVQLLGKGPLPGRKQNQEDWAIVEIAKGSLQRRWTSPASKLALSVWKEMLYTCSSFQRLCLFSCIKVVLARATTTSVAKHFCCKARRLFRESCPMLWLF